MSTNTPPTPTHSTPRLRQHGVRLLAASLATATAVVVLPSVDQRLADTASARPLGASSTTTKLTWKRSGTTTPTTTTTTPSAPAPAKPVPTTPTPTTPPPTTTVPATPTSIPTSATQTLTQSSAPPAGALFVATNGADTNPGTAAQPLATLAKALTRAQAGQTVVVRGGVYRQGIAGPVDTSLGTTWSTPAANVTIQGYPG